MPLEAPSGAVPDGQSVRQASIPALQADRPVLTDIPGTPGMYWGDHSVCISRSRLGAWPRRVLGDRLADWVDGLQFAIRLLRARRKHPAVVSDGGQSGHCFAWLQSVIPWGRVPHVMVDCNWYEGKTRVARWTSRAMKQYAARSVTRMAVWASHEVEDYARAFGIPREKLVYVPHYYSLEGYEYTIRDEGYLFAGGNGDRDYRTLVEAVRPIEVSAWIATTDRTLLRGIEIPPHVKVEGTTHAGFRQAIAGARLVVVAMQGGLLHSGGQQTCLNSMFMGKPTIAVGRKWAVDLIEDGLDGRIIDYGDVDGLRSAITSILRHPEEASRMGRRAQLKAQQFPSRRSTEILYRLAVHPESSVDNKIK